MTKDEILNAIRECARKLERVPTFADIRKLTKINRRNLYKHFLNLGNALREAGLEPIGPGHQVSAETLLCDWGRVARKLRRLPMQVEYRHAGKYSLRPFERHFRFWGRLPEAFEEFVKEKKLLREWEDVLKLVALHRTKQRRVAAAKACTTKAVKRKMLANRKVYGEPLWMEAMAHAPTNESGVLILFGMVARRLGFILLHAQADFPDGEALREVQKGRWQLVRIEFEYQSRNFVAHRHRKDGCDMIVCWEHNWVDCPETIEVVELKTAISNLQLANGRNQNL